MKPHFVKINYVEYIRASDFNASRIGHIEKYINVNYISEIIPGSNSIVLNGENIQLDSDDWHRVMNILLYNNN